jgi:NAD(P)-dependent dehydrogenase (short-subunit alcohol dehydrogenase family)
MSGKFKPLAGQVIVVAGAASGLGLEVARQAAKAGAAVVLTARDETAVRAACEAVSKAGGRCHPVAGDVATAEGCDRVARAAAARFGRVDSWVDADGDEAAFGHAVRALAAHLDEPDARAALVAFGRRMGKAARTELRQAKGKVAATLIKLPADWRHDSPAKAAAEAALLAVRRPMGQMAVAAKGQGLTAATEVKKHPGVVIGVGLLAIVGVAAWLGRGRLAQVAEAARPRLMRAGRTAVAGAVKRRPLLAARLAVKHPRGAAKLVKALGQKAPQKTARAAPFSESGAR